MQALADSRALHVLLNEIVTPAACTLEPGTEQTLRKQLDDMHKRAFAAAKAHLLTQTFSSWLLHTSLALHARPLRRKAGAQAWPAQAQGLVTERLTAYSKQLQRTQLQPAPLHRLRKHGKQLRYQLAASALHPAIGKTLAQLQETLGQLNDLHGAAAIFGRLPATHADIIAAIGQHHVPRHAQLLLQAEAQLKQLRREMRKLSSDSRRSQA